MTDAIHTETDLTGLSLIVSADPDPLNPREEFDQICTLVCWHRRYRLGDSHDWHDPQEFLREMEDRPHLKLPLYLYDHSGITIATTPFSCPWDSGQVGWVFIERRDFHQFGDPSDSETSVEDRAMAVMRAEVAEYDQFISGDVWWVCVEDPEGNVLDSCCGFYGLDHAVAEGRSMLATWVTECRRKRDEALVAQIEAERPDLTPEWHSR